MNDLKKVLFLLFLIFEVASSVAQRPVVADSIAICEPGDSPAVIEESASRLLTAEEIAVATDTIIANYDSEWTELSMQGRLSFTGLPMRVNVKVYMKRGETVILSARAPIFGEVARVEMNQDSIVFINKHSRTYNTQPFVGFASNPKAYLCDLQDILLGEVAFPGNGRISHDYAEQSQWIAMPGDNTLIHPSKSLQISGAEYGFVMDSSIWQLRSFVLMLQKPNIVVNTDYQYGDSGWTLGLGISINNKKMSGEVELSYPDYAPAPLGFTVLGNKYRKVDIKEVMRF